MDNVTEKKVASLTEQGYEQTGVILQKDGKIALVELGAVRWLTEVEMWNLMHPGWRGSDGQDI